jgi:hypothetical protein
MFGCRTTRPPRSSLRLEVVREQIAARVDKTVVTWAMYGKKNFMGKVMSVFMDRDKICGPQFEKGLADLGGVVAAASPAQ